MTKQETPPDVRSLDGILPAIAAAMGDVQKVGKGERNKHDGYNFASIDNFLALVNPICARHGLVIFSDEAEREEFTRKGRQGDNPWMRVTFAFTVHHISGQSLPVMRRSVEVMRNGAQAYGSAQSYCLKQFLRGLFLIPTGDDDDADHQRKDEGQIVRHDAPPPAEPSAHALHSAIDCLASAETLDDLRDVWGTLAKPVQANAEVLAAKNARKAQLTAPPADDLGGDEIPY